MKKTILITVYIMIIAASLTTLAYGNSKDYAGVIEELNSRKENALRDIEYYQAQMEYISSSISQAEAYGDTASLSELREKAKNTREILSTLSRTIAQIQADINYYKNI